MVEVHGKHAKSYPIQGSLINSLLLLLLTRIITFFDEYNENNYLVHRISKIQKDFNTSFEFCLK